MSERLRLLVWWLLALGLATVFAGLGAWQSRRAGEKEQMLAAAERALDRRAPLPLASAADPAKAKAYAWATGEGVFDTRGPLWLDNQQRGGRQGVRAYRIFVPRAGAPLLVDLGWLPLPGNRALPPIARPVGAADGPLTLRGLLAPPPSAGLAMGPAMARAGDGWLLARVDPAAITRVTGLSRPLAPRVLRLDPSLPLGYERDLTLLANTLPPEKHRGYAVQWFALALTVLITAFILTVRRSRR